MSLWGHKDLTCYEGGGNVTLGNINLTLYEGGGDVTLGSQRLDFI